MDEHIKRHLQNLEETSPNEGSHELACRCADSLAIIRSLLPQSETTQPDQRYQIVPVEPTTALLHPFIGCPESELALAWAAMIRIAKMQMKHGIQKGTPQ